MHRLTNPRAELWLGYEPADKTPMDTWGPLHFAVAVVVCRGTVLLVRSAETGAWELPGGLVENGESGASCAARELFEEAGLTTSGPLKLVGHARLWLGVSRWVDSPRAVYGAVLLTQAERPFARRGSIDGTEISEAWFWPVADMPSPLSEIDFHVLQRVLDDPAFEIRWRAGNDDE